MNYNRKMQRNYIKGMSRLSNNRTMSVMITQFLKPPPKENVPLERIFMRITFSNKMNLYVGCMSFTN